MGAEDRVEDAELYLTAFNWLCVAVVRNHGALWVARLAILPPPPAWRLPGWALAQLTALPQVLCERHIALHARKRGPGLMTESGARADLQRQLLAQGAPGLCPDWVPRDPQLDLGYCPVAFAKGEEPAACIVLRAADRLRTRSRRMKPLHASFYVLHPTERPRRSAGRSPPQRFVDLQATPLQISAAARAQLNRQLPTPLVPRQLDALCAALIEHTALAPECPPSRPDDREDRGQQGWATIAVPPLFSARAYRTEHATALSAIVLHPLSRQEQLRSLVELGETAVLAATSWPASFALGPKS